MVASACSQQCVYRAFPGLTHSASLHFMLPRVFSPEGYLPRKGRSVAHGRTEGRFWDHKSRRGKGRRH